MIPDTLVIQQDIQSPLQQIKNFIESQDHTDWGYFNQAKKAFLDAFKLEPASVEKQKSWKEFTTYCESAKAIFKLQEEEGEFAAEMILKALDGLEVEINEFNPRAAPFYHPIFEKIESFKKVKEELLTKLLTFKFFLATSLRIQALRDELAKTGMRLSLKGRLFDRLSKVGNRVFPRKKALNHELHELFKSALESFAKESEKSVQGETLLFQIKLIQAFLREIHLRKSDYEEIKGKLEPLWKKGLLLKDKKEAALKAEFAQSEAYKKSLTTLFQTLKEHVAANNEIEALKVYEVLGVKIKDRQLIKRDFQHLKGELDELVQPIFHRKQAQQDTQKALLKEQAAHFSQRREALFLQMQTAEESLVREGAFKALLGLQLSLEESYKIKLDYYKRLAQELDEVDGIEALYFEIKKTQEMLRGDLASSALDLSRSFYLNELAAELKELLKDVLGRLG